MKLTLGKSHRPVVLSVCAVALLSACGGGGNSGISDQDSPQGPGPIVEPQEPVVTPVGEVIPTEDQRVIPTDEIKVYRSDSAYASVLLECALTEYTDPCTLQKLPYIGQLNASPTINEVMQRLLVTHDWMGVRFEKMLSDLPADMLPLFAPVTSIIIGSEVRPSAFYPSLGQVRLDPRRLWLSVDEKRTVATNDDPRSNFGSDLQFTSLFRFTIGDNYAWNYWSLTDDSERSVADIKLPLASLLYHELAHANDYVQQARMSVLTSDMTPLDALNELEDSRVSRRLYQDESLTAQRSYLYGLAGVRFFDDAATDFQKTLQADFVGAEMANEGKVSFYSYSSTREDVAVLMEAALMKYHFNAETHIGYANLPEGADIRCDDYIVAWGERNRLASSLVAPRAKFVMDSIAPSTALDQFFASRLGQATALRQGDGWCESRFLAPSSADRTIAGSTSTSDDWRAFLRHDTPQR